MLGRIAGYELLELVGEGGMGVVFRARDPRLNKIVAIKILPDELALNPEYRARFFREARAEASLSHPAIATCFAIDEAELDPRDLIPSKTLRPPLASKLYLTMEFVPGSDLSEIAKGEPIEIPRVLDLASQIAAGLEAAHSAGVVHRDLKPANVRVTPDSRVKILDFGLASTIPTPDGPTQDFDTSRDHVMGTCHFMAPEQTHGRTTDPRSDLFSLGVIVYLLVTGRLPFTGETIHDVTDAVRHADPPPLARYANGVSDELERIVRKLLAKDVDSRYQSAHEVRTDLGRLRSGPPPPLPPPPLPPKLLKPVLLTLSSVLVLIAGWWILQQTRPRSVAVMPLVNLTGDPQLAYLGDGLAARVIASLVRSSNLSVAAMSAVQAIKPEKRTPKNLKHELGVAVTLDGSLVKHDKILRLDLELAEGNDGSVIWAGSYDYDLAASGDVERQISRDIVERLTGPFAGRREPAPTSPKPPVVSAYDFVLRAVSALDDPDNAHGPDEALEYLTHALDDDPNFALAWACRSLALYKVWIRDRTEAAVRLAEVAADRALRLDPDLVEARLARAQVYRGTGRYADAIRELRGVLSVNPNLDEAELQLGAAYREAGDLVQAESHFRHTTEVRPYYWRNWNSLGYVRYLRANYAGAREAYGRVIQLVPEKNVGYTQLATVETRTGSYNAAIALYDRLPSPVEDGPTATNIGTAYFFRRRLDEARRYYALATRLEPRSVTVWVNLGDLDVRAGRPDSALVRYAKALQLADNQLHVDPRNRAFQVQRILCLAKLSRCDEARAALAAGADTLAAGNVDLAHKLAKIYALCGSRAEALSAVGKALDLGESPALLRDEDEFAALKSDSVFSATPAHKTP